MQPVMRVVQYPKVENGWRANSTSIKVSPARRAHITIRAVGLVGVHLPIGGIQRKVWKPAMTNTITPYQRTNSRTNGCRTPVNAAGEESSAGSMN